MATTRVFYDDKTGNIIDALGSVVGNVKSDLPSSNSFIIKGMALSLIHISEPTRPY